jgi:3-oxoacyl-[acyl-carrier protein] reductase
MIIVTEKANEVTRNINDVSPDRAIAVAGDVMDAQYIQTLVEKAAAFGGDGKIHIIVNNAGFTWDGVIHKVCGDLKNLSFLRTGLLMEVFFFFR